MLRARVAVSTLIAFLLLGATGSGAGDLAVSLTTLFRAYDYVDLTG